MLLVSAGCTPDYDLQKETEPEDGAEEPTDPVVADEEPEPEEVVDSGDTADGSGSAVPDPDLPVAVCDVSPNPVEPPFETATWDGSGSYDPEGHDIVDYSWALVSAPSGSSMRSQPRGRSINVESCGPFHSARDTPWRVISTGSWRDVPSRSPTRPLERRGRSGRSSNCSWSMRSS